MADIFDLMQQILSLLAFIWVSHLFRANNIRFLNKTLTTQHLTPQNDPQNDLQKRPPNMTRKITRKNTLQNYPSKRAPLNHAHKAQDHAEIKIISEGKMNFCLQN